MRYKPIPELTERQLKNFWLKIDKRGPDDCWEWTAGKIDTGYGHIKLRPNGIFYAHRVAHHLATGKQPGPLCVCHKCDNPGCCNPSHLLLGTQAVNLADMVAKGRSAAGVDNAGVKLTVKQVLKIRASNTLGAALAVEYNVSESAISNIRRGKSWRHLYA